MARAGLMCGHSPYTNDTYTTAIKYFEGNANEAEDFYQSYKASESIVFDHDADMENIADRILAVYGFYFECYKSWFENKDLDFDDFDDFDDEDYSPTSVIAFTPFNAVRDTFSYFGTDLISSTFFDNCNGKLEVKKEFEDSNMRQYIEDFKSLAFNINAESLGSESISYVEDDEAESVSPLEMHFKEVSRTK
jgi:hypothetical protein